MIGRRGIVFAAAGIWFAKLTAAAPLSKFEIVKSDEEWRRELTSEQYAVLRRHDTERAWTSTRQPLLPDPLDLIGVPA